MILWLYIFIVFRRFKFRQNLKPDQLEVYKNPGLWKKFSVQPLTTRDTTEFHGTIQVYMKTLSLYKGFRLGGPCMGGFDWMWLEYSRGWKGFLTSFEKKSTILVYVQKWPAPSLPSCRDAEIHIMTHKRKSAVQSIAVCLINNKKISPLWKC